MTGRLARRVVLVGWDAADWKVINPLLDSGQMPGLQSIVENGVRGDLASLAPMISPLLWTSIATGHAATRHGVLSFLEPDPATGGVRARRRHDAASATAACAVVRDVLDIPQAGLMPGVYIHMLRLIIAAVNLYR